MFHYATALRSSDPSQRRTALKELCELQDGAPVSALDYLIPLLNDADEGIREGAMEAVLKLSNNSGTGMDAVIRYLEEMFTGSSGRARMRLLRLVSHIGPGARKLVPMLVSALRTTNPINARMTAEALCSIGKDAIPALEAVQNDSDATVRREASRALAKLQGSGAPA
jgi:HEAT repeat protein